LKLGCKDTKDLFWTIQSKNFQNQIGVFYRFIVYYSDT